MAVTTAKHVKSKYKYVSGINVSGNIYWCISINGVSKTSFKTEYDAAKAVDVILIRRGKEPINVLKRV